MTKFIVHFTTFPPRSPFISKTIESWLNQTYPIEKIVISLTRDCILPDYKNDKVLFQYVEKDYGPATKILGVLKYYQDNPEFCKGKYFIIGDDDLYYRKEVCEIYNRYCDKFPDKSLDKCLTFFKKEERIGNITHIQGADSYVLPPLFFEKVRVGMYKTFLEKCFGECPESYYQDDYLISFFLSRIGIPVENIVDRVSYNQVLYIDELHLHKDVHSRERKTIEYLSAITPGIY
jgi:hypothetical protein